MPYVSRLQCSHGQDHIREWEGAAVASVSIRELKAKTSEVIRRSEAGTPFVVTRRGRPVSVLLPLDEEAEDRILSEAPHFIRMWEKAEAEYKASKTVPWETVKRRLGLAELARRARQRR